MTIQFVIACFLVMPLRAQSDAADRLLKTVVFNGCDVPDAAPLPADVRARAREYVQRCSAFRPMVPSIPGLRAGERMMTDTARHNYERRLWNVARVPGAAALAAAYVQALHPCYEWEGYHDCPEHEAVFAETYLVAHSSSPFAEYLPLLAAHRWRCAADAYEYEAGTHVPPQVGSVGLNEARRRGEADLAKALRSSDPLVRFAAETLQHSGTCF